MRDEILTYLEMCSREGLSLQRGMNFRRPPLPSIVLMSRRPRAPYQDEISEDGTELLYEGHDVRRSAGIEPKQFDRPWTEGKGAPTENSKFAEASQATANRHLVRAYEKLRPGIWSDKGLFRLVGYTYDVKPSENRKVFKFRMALTDDEPLTEWSPEPPLHSRMIPASVKQEVFKRDGGKCVICGSTELLHFDHDFPFSKGGSSITAENVRILCARHNLAKGARIE